MTKTAAIKLAAHRFARITLAVWLNNASFSRIEMRTVRLSMMPNKAKWVNRIYQNNFAVTYHKVAKSITSRLVAPPRIHRLSMKGKFNVYLLLPFGEKLIFAIVGLLFATLQKMF